MVDHGPEALTVIRGYPHLSQDRAQTTLVAGALRSDGEIFQHLVDPFDDETGLLGDAVILAGTAHVPESAEIELRLDTPLPCFNGKDMGLAGYVLLLDRVQEQRLDLHPEKRVDSRTDRFSAQKFSNPLHIRSTNFIDKIRLQAQASPSRTT